MKTVETKLYSFRELSPMAQDRVIENEAERIQNDPDNFTASECVDSLKAIAGALGLRLTDWCIGPYNCNNGASVNSDASGNKAIAEFVRVLIAHKYERKPTFAAMLDKKTGSFTGMCGFTGMWADEPMAEAILDALLGGETMSKAFDRAADEAMRICEQDLEYRTSREGVLEYLDQDAEIYTEGGSEF